MKKRSKRYKESRKKVDRTKKYEIDNALEVLKNYSKTKFDETVEISLNLGINPKKTDQIVRGSMVLPKGIGRKVKIAVFAEGEKAEKAKEAGAQVVGGADLVNKIKEGWMDFDVAISAPEMMRHVGKLGPILGPQGKMPSPKTGTVTEKVDIAVEEFIAGKIEYRTDSGGIVHAPVGKLSFSKEDLKENVNSFINHINNSRPSSVKGTFVRKISLATSMGPGIELALPKRA